MSAELDQQCEHVRCTGLLIAWIYANGYRASWGQALRTQLEANANAASGAGISNSLHLIKMAVDLSVFRVNADGSLTLLESVDDYRPIGEYWESLHPLARWGGRFGDADHFSLTFQGVS